jgi:hypothetical protein
MLDGDDRCYLSSDVQFNIVFRRKQAEHGISIEHLKYLYLLLIYLNPTMSTDSTSRADTVKSIDNALTSVITLLEKEQELKKVKLHLSPHLTDPPSHRAMLITVR